MKIQSHFCAAFLRERERRPKNLLLLPPPPSPPPERDCNLKGPRFVSCRFGKGGEEDVKSEKYLFFSETRDFPT